MSEMNEKSDKMLAVRVYKLTKKGRIFYEELQKAIERIEKRLKEGGGE